MRETARDHTPMTALPYYHVAARAVPAITATPCAMWRLTPRKKTDGHLNTLLSNRVLTSLNRLLLFLQETAS